MLTDKPPHSRCSNNNPDSPETRRTRREFTEMLEAGEISHEREENSLGR